MCVCACVCACVCIVSVIEKHLVLPLCAIDGHSTNPIYYYYKWVALPSLGGFRLVWCVGDGSGWFQTGVVCWRGFWVVSDWCGVLERVSGWFQTFPYHDNLIPDTCRFILSARYWRTSSLCFHQMNWPMAWFVHYRSVWDWPQRFDPGWAVGRWLLWGEWSSTAKLSVPGASSALKGESWAVFMLIECSTVFRNHRMPNFSVESFCKAALKF